MIKEIELSNLSVKTIEKYNNYLEKPFFFVVQNNYNLIVRRAAGLVVESCCNRCRSGVNSVLTEEICLKKFCFYPAVRHVPVL